MTGVLTSGSEPLRVYSSVWHIPCRKKRTSRETTGGKRFGVGSGLACVENFDSDFVCTRGFDLDIIDLEWLACTPAYGGLALDDLSGSFGHGGP